MLSPIAHQLFNRGITKSVAVDFAESFSQEYLLEKIQMHDYKRETGELTTNAAGWLREAIVRDYKPSEQQLKKQARLLEKKALKEEQRTLEEKAREIQEQRLKEALANFPSDEQWVRERVMEHVNVSIPTTCLPSGMAKRLMARNDNKSFWPVCVQTHRQASCLRRKPEGGEQFTEEEIEEMYLRYRI